MKTMLDAVVVENNHLNKNYVLLKLTTKDGTLLPEVKAGQFVEIRVDGSTSTFLRRPISINFIDKHENQLWILIQIVGEGTRAVSQLKHGQIINLLIPLGNSFSFPENKDSSNILLIGGGVGTAPLLYWGSELRKNNFKPCFLLGARSINDLLQLDEFAKYGDVYTTTEDGSHGDKGYVTNHSIFDQKKFSHIYTCGSKPMMLAVAKYAHTNNIFCEASLEKTMACGFGVCLCCVENTKKGNLCVCTEGPIFNINELKWID